MHSFYNQNDDFSRPAPSAPGVCGQTNLPPCSNYYTHGLFRQYTNSSSFHDFFAILGGSTLVRTSGYHLVCVSASARDSSNVMQEGVVLLKYQIMGMKSNQTCLAP